MSKEFYFLTNGEKYWLQRFVKSKMDSEEGKSKDQESEDEEGKEPLGVE